MAIASFALIFDAEVSQQLTEYSAAIARAGVKNECELGEGTLPHMTILQFEADGEEDLEMIWQEATSCKAVVELTFAGICLLPGDDNIWLEIPVLKSAAVTEFQRNLLALPAIRDRQILNGTGDSFRPHVTVGLTSELDALPPVGREVLRARDVRARLGLGWSGPNYTFPVPVFS